LASRGRIFISYRRDDAPADARGLRERLGRAFGASNVFMDVDSLMAGERFERVLDQALEKSDVLIAVIGSRWLALLEEYEQQGRRDYVREEIAGALKKDMVVVPVLIGREGSIPVLPSAKNLPENIRDLVAYQKISIAHETFRRDSDDLVAELKAVLRKKYGPEFPWRMIAAAAIVLLLAGAGVGYWTEILPMRRALNDVGSPHSGAAARSEEAASEKAAEEGAADAARKKAAEDEAARKATEAQQQADTDAVHKKAEDEAKRRADGDAKAAEEARKRAAENEAARKKAEEKAQANVVTDCDRLAASPFDRDRPVGVAGVYNSVAIDLAAGAACDDAMKRYPDVARFAHQAGRVAYGRQDYTRAAALYNTAMAKGSVIAIAAAGSLYLDGHGVTQDYGRARQLFEQGAALGDPVAINDLGAMYSRGLGVAQDYAKALSLYQKSADLGYPTAMANLGALYRDGRGVSQDIAAGLKLFQKAAALGSAPGMRELGELYEGGRGVSQDFREAQSWYNRAAALGDASAMYRLGSLYHNGRGVPQDYKVARDWYRKAAASGDGRAVLALGTIPDDGDGPVIPPRHEPR
jgi:TPR repeat protein